MKQIYEVAMKKVVVLIALICVLMIIEKDVASEIPQENRIEEVSKEEILKDIKVLEKYFDTTRDFSQKCEKGLYPFQFNPIPIKKEDISTLVEKTQEFFSDKNNLNLPSSYPELCPLKISSSISFENEVYSFKLSLSLNSIEYTVGAMH